MAADFVTLRSAVTGFCRREQRTYTTEQVATQAAHLGQTIDIMRREQARLTALALGGARGSDRDGFGSDVDWVRHNCRLSFSEAAQVVAVGAHLSQLPESSAALDRGEVGFGHLVHMARNAAFIARRKTGTFDERPLLARARYESVNRFRHTCLSLRHAQDPEGVVLEELSAVEQREVSFSPAEGGVTWMNLCLDTPTAAMIQVDTARRAKPLGPDDRRSRSRREADAIIERLLGAAGPAVEVTVSCTPATLLGLPGAPAAELEYTEPISGELLRRLSCNASFTKILLDDKLVPVAAAHTRRVPTRKERKAMDLQQQHCRGRGCHRPARQCSPHHVVWYSRSRRTKISEMVLLCPHHHWMVHEGGWDVALKADGEVFFIPPFARGPTGSVAA